MARTTSIQAKATSSTKRITIGFINSASTLLSRITRKLQHEPRAEPKSQLAKPKNFLSTIIHKAAWLRSKKKGNKSDGGDQGLWQKTILMGEKCDPLDFSGVIYYDSNGKQIQELPVRSPRASPLPNYSSEGRDSRQAQRAA